MILVSCSRLVTKTWGFDEAVGTFGKTFHQNFERNDRRHFKNPVCAGLVVNFVQPWSRFYNL